MRKLKLLIIDSDQTFTWNVLRTMEESREIEVIGCESDGIKGLKQIYTLNPDVVLLDVQLPGMDGISVLRELRLMKKAPVAIVCTNFYSDFCVVTAHQNGAGYILYKPIDFRTLPMTVCDCYKSVHSAPYKARQQSACKTARAEDAYRLRALLFEMGMPPKFVGSMYIVESVLIAQENRMLLSNLSKGLYAEIAKRLNTTPGSVERSLRNVISTTYERGNLSKSFDHRPTNKQFLVYLLNVLRDEQVTASV